MNSKGIAFGFHWHLEGVTFGHVKGILFKAKGIVFMNERHLEEIPLENLKGADLAGAAGGRDASSSLHFTHATHLHKDSTATQGWQVVVLSLWRCVARVKCKLEEASRPPAVPARLSLIHI